MKYLCQTKAGNILLWILFSAFPGISQSTTYGWGAVFVNGPFENKWGFYVDAQVRSDNQSSHLKSWLIRPAVQRKLGNRNLLSVGYALVETNLRTTEKIGSLTEHRIWQQWTHLQPIFQFTLQHRLRIEQRFIGSPNYTLGAGNPTPGFYSTRIRYFNRLLIPWNFQKTFSRGPYGGLQNEIFLNLSGKEKINDHFYDQNRLYFSLGYRLDRALDIEAGYMLRETQLSASRSVQHIWQLAAYLRP